MHPGPATTMDEQLAHFRSFAPDELGDDEILALIKEHGGSELKIQNALAEVRAPRKGVCVRERGCACVCVRV